MTLLRRFYAWLTEHFAGFSVEDSEGYRALFFDGDEANRHAIHGAIYKKPPYKTWITRRGEKTPLKTYSSNENPIDLHAAPNTGRDL